MKTEINSRILQKKVLSVQFLRGISALLVIFYHYGFINFWNISILDRNSIEVKSSSSKVKRINVALSKTVERLNSRYNDRINFIDASNFICTGNEKHCKVYEEKKWFTLLGC